MIKFLAKSTTVPIIYIQCFYFHSFRSAVPLIILETGFLSDVIIASCLQFIQGLVPPFTL
jgi:hypothetical protein